MKERELSKRNRYIFYFTLTIVIFLLMNKAYSILLISPDDIAYENIMSGTYTGKPDGHCYFIRYPLSKLLAQLYKVTENIHWYELFMMSLLFLCLFLVFLRFDRIKKKDRFFCITAAVFVFSIVFIPFYINLEWTVTAGVAASTAVFRYLTIPQSEHKDKGEYIICLFLLLAGYCIRSEIIFMYLPLAFLCWLSVIIRERKEKNIDAVKKNSVFIIICIFGIVLISFFHMQAYRDKGWTDYSDFTKDRSILYDYYGYPNYYEWKDVYDEAGISYEMYALLMSDYNFLVPGDKAAVDGIKTIADLSRDIFGSSKITRWREVKDILYTAIQMKDLRSLHILCILLSAGAGYLRLKKKVRMGCLMGAVCWLLAGSVYLAYKGRFPYRVSASMEMGFIAVLGAYLYQFGWMEKAEDFSKKRSYYVYILSILAGLAASKLIIYKQQNEINRTYAVERKEIVSYCKAHSDSIFFRDFASFSQQGKLFMQYEEYDAHNYISAGGWLYNSPIYQQIEKRFDFADFTEAVKKNDNLYYLVNKERESKVIQRMNNFYFSEKIPIAVEKADEFNTNREKAAVLKFVYRKRKE